jgi:hypothetical protein
MSFSYLSWITSEFDTRHLTTSVDLRVGDRTPLLFAPQEPPLQFAEESSRRIRKIVSTDADSQDRDHAWAGHRDGA